MTRILTASNISLKQMIMNELCPVTWPAFNNTLYVAYFLQSFLYFRNIFFQAYYFNLRSCIHCEIGLKFVFIPLNNRMHYFNCCRVPINYWRRCWHHSSMHFQAVQLAALADLCKIFLFNAIILKLHKWFFSTLKST